MKKLTILILLFITFASTAIAQKTLSNLDYVNTQILADTNSSGERTESVYLVEKGVSYIFDGRLDITFPLEILGPDDSPILTATEAPILVNSPGDDGAARDFFEIKSGGSLVLKNLVVGGLASNGERTSAITVNTGGTAYTAENCVFSDWDFVVFRNLGAGIDISYTNCVFINGVRLSYSPWGGFPMRMDASGNNVTIENNTMVNTGRLLGNSGPWFTAKVLENHNTYLNSSKAGHEQRAYEMIQANNIFYNFDFAGAKTTAVGGNTYDQHFTTWNYFADAKLKLDSISLFLGSNLFYRDQAILDFFAANDTIQAGLLWEHADVDSFVTLDDNYTIGTNYSQIMPDFATPPDNSAKLLEWLTEYWKGADRLTDAPDWRVQSVVTWDGDGLPVLNWPPAFDLSYSDEGLKNAGTDGLPLGDLNWFPTEKADYYTNRDAYVAELKDSIENAKAVYVPGSPTPMITEITTSVEQVSDVISDNFYLENNYPNPFNPSTTIRFGLPQQAKVTLSVFNVIGEKVLEITEQSLAAGSHSFNFDASQLSSGIYVYKMNAVGANGEKFVASKKMMLLK